MPGSTEIPAFVLNGSEGPTVWVHGAIHGDEYGGSLVVLNLLNRLKPNHIRGTLILVPVLNIPAFQDSERTSFVDHVDLNRVFPGSAPGDVGGGFTQRYAAQIFSKMSSYADYLIDLHTGGPDSLLLNWGVYTRSGGDVEEQSRKMVQSALSASPGPRHIWADGTQKLRGSLIHNMAKRGVPSIILENGGSRQMQRVITGEPDRYVEETTSGVLNLLKYLKVLEGRPQTAREFNEFSDLDFRVSECEGFFQSRARLGQRIKKGAVMGELRDLYNSTSEVRATASCTALTIRTNPFVRVGDLLYELAVP